MAKRNLNVVIECGEKTCFDPDTQTMCSKVFTKRFGTQWVCGIFKDPNDKVSDFEMKFGELDGTETGNPERYLLRCPECIKAEEDATASSCFEDEFGFR